MDRVGEAACLIQVRGCGLAPDQVGIRRIGQAAGDRAIETAGDPVEAFLGPLAGIAASLTGVAIPGEPNTLSAQQIAEAGRAVRIPSGTAASVSEALAAITARVGQDAGAEAGQTAPCVLICGSLYLAGTILRDNA